MLAIYLSGSTLTVLARLYPRDQQYYHYQRTPTGLPPLPKLIAAEKHGGAVIDLAALPRTYLLDETQAAAALNVARGTLSVWRSTGRWNLRFTKIGRSVRYTVGDLLDFIERRTRANGATE